MTKLLTPNRHTGGRRYPDALEIPGFRVALAIASLPGMTIELFREFLSHHTNTTVAQSIDRTPTAMRYRIAAGLNERKGSSRDHHRNLNKHADPLCCAGVTIFDSIVTQP
jgi:hypothetical protein